MTALRSWIDRNIVVIGAILLCVGLAGTMLVAVRDMVPFVTGEKNELLLIGLVAYVLVSLANPLAYNSVLLIVVGLLLRRGEFALVGFENTKDGDLAVEGPDADHVVWIGKRFPNAFDAELAASALNKRLTSTEA